jgi:hypothetical protein
MNTTKKTVYAGLFIALGLTLSIVFHSLGSSQFGSIFFGWGLALLTASILAFLLAGWYSFSALCFILAIEERETLEEFGEEYCRFLMDRPPFNFSPRCIMEGVRALRAKTR